MVPRALRVLAVALGLFAGADLRTDAADGAAAIPDATRSGIESALQTKVGALLKEKDGAGLSNKRGFYSKRFQKVDDSTYQVAFTTQTAGAERMTSERFRLTLKKDANGMWAIAKEEKMATFDDMWRRTVGSETFQKFDRLSFDREGLKVTATGGVLYTETLNGKPRTIAFGAPDLKFEYAPPLKSAGYYTQTYNHFRKQYPNDFAFTPEFGAIECTPAECEDILTTAFTGLAPSSVDAAPSALQDAYRKDRKETEDARHENAFSGFTILPFPDRKLYTFYFRKKAIDDHYFFLGYDNYDPKEVSMGVTHLGASYTGYAPLLSYYSKETLDSGVAPYDLEKRDDPEGRYYDLESVAGNIDMALDDPEVLTADITFTLKMKKALDSIRFQIARLRPIGTDKAETKNPKMTVNAAQLDDGTELTTIKTGAFSGMVLLPATTKVGDTVKIRMQFENRDSIYKLTPSFSYVDRGGWLPFVRFGDMIHSFDITVRVPERYKILGIGKEVYQRKEGATTVAHFTSPAPIEFPSIVFGDYFEEKPDHVPTKSDGTPINVRIFLDRISMSDWEIPVKNLKPIAAEAAVALDLYKKIYGIDYLYDKLDLVNDARGGFYGQAPSSIVYLGSPVFRGRGLMGSAGGASLANFQRSVVAHEVGHQWWGSLVSNANTSNYWFVESLAEYSAALFVEEIYGKDAYLKHVADWRKNVLDSDMNHSVQDASVLASPDPGSYQAAVYNQGPYAFHILRTTFGDDKFFPFLKELASSLKGKEIVTRDLQLAMEKSFGGNMEWFMDQWIRGIGVPEYAFTYAVRKTEDGKFLVSGKVKQRVVVGRAKDVMDGVFYRGIVPITVVGGKDREYPVRIKVEGAETPFQFKVPEEPVDVVFNRNGEILARDVLVNQSW